MDETERTDAEATGCDTTSDLKSKCSPFLPPCRVCNNPASGFHYGVNTCEACKGFFRRSISRKMPYSACCRGGECAVQLENRNSCMECRLKKCHSVGMSKSAIKTGRYTHQKRTRDTLEVKSSVPTSKHDKAVSQTSAPILTVSSPSGSTTARIPNRSSSTCKERKPSYCKENAHPLDTFDPETIALSERLIAAFRRYFSDTTYIYEHLSEVEGIIDDILAQNGLTEIETVIAVEGNGADCEVKTIKKITEQVEILKSFKQLNSSVSGDLITDDALKSAFKELFESWSINVDRFVQNAVNFAKTIPGFLELPVDDQVHLIKYGRSEIAGIVKFKHFDTKFDAFVDYHSETKAMYVFPNHILSKLILTTDSEEASKHTWVFNRMMLQLGKLKITLNDLSILCALIICSPDREQLTEEGKKKLTSIHSQLLSALEYCLTQTHPGQDSILAKYLMILPSLREMQELNNRALSQAQERLKPELSPLLQEVLPKETPAASRSRNSDTPYSTST